MSLEIVILAAGQGTRMRSALPKVLHPIAGNSMLGHVIHSARQLDPTAHPRRHRPRRRAVRERLAADDLNFVLQDKQLGTGHAVAQAVPFIESRHCLDSLRRRAVDRSRNPSASARARLRRSSWVCSPSSWTTRPATAVSCATPPGKVTAIVEQKDANEAERAITEGNTGILAAAFRAPGATG